ALGRRRRPLGIVQVHDGARLGSIEDVAHLSLGRHGTEALGLDGPKYEALAVPPERAEQRHVHHAPGRSEVTGLAAGQLGEDLVRARHLALGRLRAAEPEAPMRPGVARDLMALAAHSPLGLGRSRGALSADDERRARLSL